MIVSDYFAIEHISDLEMQTLEVFACEPVFYTVQSLCVQSISCVHLHHADLVTRWNLLLALYTYIYIYIYICYYVIVDVYNFGTV